jgi:hypothetical protein
MAVARVHLGLADDTVAVRRRGGDHRISRLHVMHVTIAWTAYWWLSHFPTLRFLLETEESVRGDTTNMVLQEHRITRSEPPTDQANAT